MTSTELQHLIRDFYLEHVTLLQRHEAVACVAPDYDVNNAYQYVICREETHVSWLLHALRGLEAPSPSEPARATLQAPGKGLDRMRQLAGEDARASQAFIAKWTPLVETVTHVRHRNMLKVILGEMSEHARLFAQAGEGRTDIIGLPVVGTERKGSVAPTRWME